MSEASGVAARDALVTLLGGDRGRDGRHVVVRGPRLSCTAVGTSYSRTVARCRTPGGVDLSEALVARGVAVRWRR